jgi:hypothetical protein
MELFIDSKKFENYFLSLLEKYPKYYWMTAWASSKSLAFEYLRNNKCRIEKIIVGLHFYQTHPDFIESFLDTSTVRYIKQSKGTFHPKMFLFYKNNTEWELLIGSANFTNAAFTENTEITTLIKSSDINANLIIRQVFDLINNYWDDSNLFDEVELEDYRKIWENFIPKINSLKGTYRKETSSLKKKIKPIFLKQVTKMDWQDYMANVYSDKSLDIRLQVLEISKSLFAKVESFRDLSVDERKFIAGMPNALPVDKGVDWGFFGSMKGAGKFKNRIIENDENISMALDEIPLSGHINEMHYQRFLIHYKRAFKGNYLATATRLLAMKRPDVFVCLDSKNKSKLCEKFEIVKAGLDYDRYWDEIILQIYDSQWWFNPNPKNKKEKSVRDSRAAFLDSLYYEE